MAHPKLRSSSSLVGGEKRNEGEGVGMGKENLPKAFQSLSVFWSTLKSRVERRWQSSHCCCNIGIWDVRAAGTSATASPDTATGWLYSAPLDPERIIRWRPGCGEDGLVHKFCFVLFLALTSLPVLTTLKCSAWLCFVPDFSGVEMFSWTTVNILFTYSQTWTELVYLSLPSTTPNLSEGEKPCLAVGSRESQVQGLVTGKLGWWKGG